MNLGNLFKIFKIKKVLKFGFIFFGVNVLIFCLAFYRNESQRFMPYEYKLVQKIFNKISLNNDLGDRPVTVIIRAGEDMHFLSKDLGLCKDKDNYCAYYVNLNPFKKYKGYRANDLNNALNQAYLRGHIGAGASPTGNIVLDRSTFKVLERKESYLASILAHEMFHILQFGPFEASLETLKDTRENEKLTKKEMEDIFLKKSQVQEAEADLGGALMLYYADYPKDTFLKSMEFFYKQIGVIHEKNQSRKHPDYITRISLIKAFMNDESFNKEILDNPSAPLKWVYNRKENWLRFYPNKKTFSTF